MKRKGRKEDWIKREDKLWGRPDQASPSIAGSSGQVLPIRVMAELCWTVMSWPFTSTLLRYRLPREGQDLRMVWLCTRDRPCRRDRPWRSQWLEAVCWLHSPQLSTSPSLKRHCLTHLCVYHHPPFASFQSTSSCTFMGHLHQDTSGSLFLKENLEEEEEWDKL